MMGQDTSLPPPCSNLRPFESKCTVLKKSVYDIVGTCWPPAVIPRPGIVPPFPSLCLWYYAIKIGKFSESEQISKSERHEHVQFSKTIRYGSCTDSPQRLLAAFKVSSCSFVSLLCLLHALFGVDLCLFC